MDLTNKICRFPCSYFVFTIHFYGLVNGNWIDFICLGISLFPTSTNCMQTDQAQIVIAEMTSLV